MKFLFASDSFKGSLSSGRIGEILTEEAGKVFPDCICETLPVADGGEGTVEAVVQAAGGQFRTVKVHGPLFEEREAVYGILPDGSAVIEMAAASGLPLVPVTKRNPLHTTSFGTGELIADAMEQGCRKIAVAIGGSASNDGGMGAMRALGVRFLDASGTELRGTGADLEQVCRIDTTGLHREAKNTVFTVMCDVDNPLLGPDGAAYTFGPQKGADAAMILRLEEGMRNYAELMEHMAGEAWMPEPCREAGQTELPLWRGTNRRWTSVFPGAGAAGGLGAALSFFLDGSMKSGIETVLELLHFDERLRGVDLVVTGEGRIDGQSAHGKVVSGIGLHCKRKEIPAVALVGGIGPGAEALYGQGIVSMMPTTPGPIALDTAMEEAETFYRLAAERMFRMLKAGRRLR